MIQTSLKIALRGFFRNRFFTLFNLLSLITGLFVAYVAIGYIGFENSYDKFHENSENIYRLGWTYRSQEYSVLGFENDTLANNQLRLVNGLNNVPGVEKVAQFITSNNLEFVDWNGNQVQEKELLTTNTPHEFATLFTWKPIIGSLSDFGTDFNKVLLTKSAALKIFGVAMDASSGIIGDLITIGGENYKVAAVIEDVPLNSHFNFSIVMSKPKIDYWGSRIYLGLADNANCKHVQNQLNKAMGTMNASVVKDPLYKEHFLQPLEDIHLKSNSLYELKTPGNYSFIYLIGGFAIFILTITLFNYANFTLAIKSKQGKSIGIKKAMGAKNGAVARQFFLEGVLLSLLALPFLAFLLVLIIPSFNRLMGVALSARLWENPSTLALLLVLAVILGILASIAPAMVLSSKTVLNLFNPRLKDNRYEHFSIRKYLVVSQFVILISISSVSYFVIKQMHFIEHKDIGFKKDDILYAYTSSEKQNIFQERLRQLPEIEHVGNGSSFGIGTFNQMTYKLKGVNDVFDDANQLYLDFEALKAYGIKTNLDLNDITSRTTIINRTAAEKFAKVKNVSVEELIGSTVITEPEYTSEDGQVGFPFVIGGVFEDINIFSLREKVEPYFIVLSPNVRMDGRSIISFKSTHGPTVLKQIKSVYESIDEAIPLEIEFLNQNISNLYIQDKQIVKLIFWMNVLAIILAAMGIIGITIFLVVAKTKEIGIRKVLGASVFHIITSNIKEYVLFVSIALLISWPIGLYISETWLSNFAYKIEIRQFVFFIIGLCTLIGTAMIVGAVSLKAARANPVKSLRTE
jgi:putative ABC transport system permease protein